MSNSELTEMYQWLTNDLRDYFSEISRTYDMTYDQYLLLKEINRRGKSRGNQLASSFGVSRAAVSRRCRELSKKGYLRRLGGEEPDFRATYFETTEKGKAAIKDLNASYETWFQELAMNFGEQDWEMMIAFLDRFHKQSQMNKAAQ